MIEKRFEVKKLGRWAILDREIKSNPQFDVEIKTDNSHDWVTIRYRSRSKMTNADFLAQIDRTLRTLNKKRAERANKEMWEERWAKKSRGDSKSRVQSKQDASGVVRVRSKQEQEADERKGIGRRRGGNPW